MKKFLISLFFALLLVPLFLTLYGGHWGLFIMLVIILIAGWVATGSFGWSTGNKRR